MKEINLSKCLQDETCGRSCRPMQIGEALTMVLLSDSPYASTLRQALAMQFEKEKRNHVAEKGGVA